MRHSRSRKGGDTNEDIAKIQTQIDQMQSSLNEIKEILNTTSSDMKQPVVMEEEQVMQEENPIQEMTTPKPWQEDKNTKFKDGQGGRVTLSFPRIIMHLDKNIQQNNTNKQWSEIKIKLLSAASVEDVQKLIKEYSIRFSANSIGGTRKKRRGGKRGRTHKRH
jgi:hypothetical protein